MTKMIVIAITKEKKEKKIAITENVASATFFTAGIHFKKGS